MKSISIRVLLLIAVVFTSTQFVQAVPITFIHEGTGDATLDGSSLGEVDFVITAQGDTDDLVDRGDRVLLIPHASASISFGRVNFDLITRTTTFVFTGWPEAGMPAVVGLQLYDPAGFGSDLFNGPESSEFDDWDMLSSIGPVSASGYIYMPVWEATGGLQTTGGLFSLQGDERFVDTPATFTAVVVPEPATLLLLGLGAAMVKRRRSI